MLEAAIIIDGVIDLLLPNSLTSGGAKIRRDLLTIHFGWAIK
jgi:hypothetical protein